MKKKSKNANVDKKINIVIAFVILMVLTVLVTNPSAIDKIYKFSNTIGFDVQNVLGIEANTTNETKIDTSQFLATDNLEVYYIDVGQADSILIINKNEAMLIDAGNNEDGESVVKFIQSKGIMKLKYVIGTHPHEDHIGGLDDVIKNFEIENILMPKVANTTKTYEDVLEAIDAKNLTITAPNKGDTFSIGQAKCTVMTTSIADTSNYNLSSIVIRLEFGKESFLFMGDSETKNENSIESWPETTVLKVGHHGSKTSSSISFLKQVNPKIAIIMVGKDNDYGLPKDDILKRLTTLGSKIYRTDESGTIKITTDGNEINIETEK